jgi:hypothetical protein
MNWTVLRGLLRLVGVALALAASYVALAAVWARMDSWEEVVFVLRLDAVLGLSFAVALVLFLGPSCTAARRDWLWLLGGAIVLAVCVSGPLLWIHWEQYRIRSTPPPLHMIGQ